MDTDSIVMLPEQKALIHKLTDLKLDGFSFELKGQFADPQRFQTMTYEQRLNRCLDSQIELASNNRFRRLLHNSKIGDKIYIKQFIASESRGLTNDTLLKLQDGDFIEKGLNIIISGPTGTGKTALAKATAVETMRKGNSAMFF